MTEGGNPSTATWRQISVGGTDISKDNPLPTGNVLSSYGPAEIDSKTGSFAYYGFEAVDGSWYIQKKTVGILSPIRYIKGDTDLATNWANRTTLSYDTFANTFG